MYDYKKMWEDNSFSASHDPKWIQIIKDNLIEGSTLEIGCGTGRFSQIFENYTGLDISKPAIETCKKLFPRHKFICEDLVTCKLGKYDNIFTWTALEHIPVEEIEQVAEKIKKAGNNLVMVEPIDFDTPDTSYCHNHDYIKLFDAEMVYDFGSVKMWRKK